MAGKMAGAAGSAQMGGVGQQMIGNGLKRPPTMEIRPGDQFNVMVTADLAFQNRIRTDSYTNRAWR
jgi:type IV secretory pathway VirB10-like protein